MIFGNFITLKSPEADVQMVDRLVQKFSLTDELGNKFGMQVSSLFGGYNLTPLSKVNQISRNPSLHKKKLYLFLVLLD